MSISAEGNKHTYDGDDATTVFAFTFDALDASHVKVFLTDADGADTLLPDNFTVSLSAKTVTYPNSGNPLPTGEKITLIRDTPRTQGVDLKQQGSYDAKTMEDALDKLTMIVEDLAEQVNRAFKIGISETVSPTTNSEFLAAINASYPVTSEGTFNEMQALVEANPTTKRFAFITDLQVWAIYVANTNVGDNGWYFNSGG